MAKVTSLKEFKERKAEEIIDSAAEHLAEIKAQKKAIAEDFKEIEKKNKQNAERMRKERNNANRSVLRSYRIKPQ